MKRSILSRSRLTGRKGIALVLALLMSLSILALASGVLYFISQSTSMSGAGKRYATAAEAAEGAVDVMKDTVNLTMWGEPQPGVFPGTNCKDQSGNTQSYNLSFAILNEDTFCQTNINMPGVMGSYTAEVTILRLYTLNLPGGRLEFAKAAGGASSTAIVFRITTKVEGPDNAVAENTVLYRFVG